MNDFQQLWLLFRSHGSSNTRRDECEKLWDTYSPSLQQLLFDTIRRKLDLHRFVHYDPLRAMKENALALQSQTLSFNDYYRRYNTSEERDGWHMTNPTGNKVIYVRTAVA